MKLIATYYPEGKAGRLPFSWQSVLRDHFLPKWFTLFALSNLWMVRGKLMRVQGLTESY